MVSAPPKFLGFDSRIWTGRPGILKVRRSKTKVLIDLPLLPAIAQAPTSYLRWERPPSQSTPYLFLRKKMPYEPITSSAIRYRIRHYARLAGISAKVIGAHAFRHSHATSGSLLRMASLEKSRNR